jgi:hypothetical protein
VVFTSSIYLAHSLRYARPAMLRAANVMTKAEPKVVSNAAYAIKGAL